MQKIPPKYLYHYTSISNLALIVKNRTIKFSCLENLNDLNEGITSDLGKFGKYVFVSSWTKEARESIPLWSMYTPNMTGVRIKLPSNPFKSYGNVQIQGTRTFSGIFPNSIVPADEIVGKNYLVFPTSYKLTPIKYTEDVNLLQPKIRTENDDKRVTYLLKLLGIHKTTAWKFELEWRYILWILPSAPFDNNDINYDDKMVSALRGVGENVSMPFSHYFLSLREDTLENMEIVIGPKCSDGDWATVKAIVEMYNPKATIKSSTLKIR
ncbi:MAG: DUF2971 domain-containing protein [Chloroflexi bacterium]|nr:DUF2971 domain-containing protein [Chloroflexota bacterium]